MQQTNQEFSARHIGPRPSDLPEMLQTIGVESLDSLIDQTIPSSIRLSNPLKTGNGMSEYEYLQELKTIASKNKLYRSHIGQGYYPTITPSVILRNLFENPGWYTQYTPYQAEIAQGRLESLLNYQTMVSDLTALPIANASLLDEGTAAAEGMALLFNQKNKDQHALTSPRFFVDQYCFSQTIQVLITRATPLNIEVVVGNYQTFVPDESYFGALVQYPNAQGSVEDYQHFIQKAHASNVRVMMATDLLALCLLTPPGELGADIAVGSAQRFGVPMGFGGPHAAFFATKDEYKRNLPGRIIGVSLDAQGNRCLRMALQTREQHIRREKATSNICTAQALLANMAAMYAIYHGPDGLRNIATRVHTLAQALSQSLNTLGYPTTHTSYFDSIHIKTNLAPHIKTIAENNQINLFVETEAITISLDETSTISHVNDLIRVFAQAKNLEVKALSESIDNVPPSLPSSLVRTSNYLLHPVFHQHRSETQMMRYLKYLENKDLSLNTSMISLGSCTMKLNAATELIPVSWPEFGQLHPFAPSNQWEGYQQILQELSMWLNDVTGFTATSLQPNSGAQGEYTGLLAIRAYHEARKENHRKVMLIPISAHGTNPASAVMAGFQVVVTKCDDAGNIDMYDLKTQAEKHKDQLAGLMITYPSTHGVFEETVKEICELIHTLGGLVYMDGANMNAQVGLTSPGQIGADVCHLNLHKTFAIPHGGGGPGMGPICVNDKLAPYLPGHVHLNNSDTATTAVSAAPYGSASILLISYAYIKMLGSEGLRKSTEMAILNANYMKARLEKDYSILYTGKNGTCAHEFILDLRPFKQTAGIEAEDVAKRLMDYNFHAPTMSFPVAGTIMIEPTESEDKAELDRFCDALLQIRAEITAVETGMMDKQDNPLKHAPHTQKVVMAETWTRPYSRQQAAFPLEFVQNNKFWPSVSRVNNTYGDRNLVCTCEPVSAYAEME
jgi:glycine dehydrogenase